MVLLRALGRRGYAGGITILREHLTRLRPAVMEEPVVQFETEPGRQMQVDWAVIRHAADPLEERRSYRARLGLPHPNAGHHREMLQSWERYGGNGQYGSGLTARREQDAFSER